jgi:hypothetical protein
MRNTLTDEKFKGKFTDEDKKKVNDLVDET